MTEYALVLGKSTQKPIFSVCKEGIEFLRKLQHKKIRVIFNIVEGKRNLRAFNQAILNHKDIVLELKKLESDSMVTICGLRQLTQNRTLLCMNAYGSHEKMLARMTLIGYLIASCFFYHCQSQLSEQSPLSSLLRSINRQLSSTNLSKLESQIKFRSGFAIKPYFMCLFYCSLDQPRQHFRSFYHFKEGKPDFNESVEALTDYFPERSALVINQFCMVKQLGDQLVKDVLGRKILNFQVTGSMIESLCHELCQVYNHETQHIDLVKTYTRIINQQKHNVKGRSYQLYLHLIQQVQKSFPKQKIELKDQLSSIQRRVMEQNVSDAVNCMDMIEYQTIIKDLFCEFERVRRRLQDKNEESIRDRVTKVYEQLQQQIDSFQNYSFSNSAELIKDKLDLFIDQTIQDYNTKDLLSRLISKYLDRFSESAQLLLAQYAHITESNESIQQILKQNTLLQEKNKQLEKQLQQELFLKDYYKIRFEQRTQVLLKFDEEVKNKQIMILKKQNRELLEQITDKQIKIAELEDILAKFDNSFQKKSSKNKFSKDAQNILTEISTKVHSIYQLLNKVNDASRFYSEIEKQFELKKKAIEDDCKQQKQKIYEVQRKLAAIIQEKFSLQETLLTEKKIIQVALHIRDEYDNSLNDLEMNHARLQGQKADIDGQLQDYQKALDLVIDYIKTGKSENLRKFIKVTADSNLRETLTQLIHLIHR